MENTIIIGHGRHGKDEVALILNQEYGVTFTSSSQLAADLFIFDLLKGTYGYKDSQECFDDRHNHRDIWYKLICEYNQLNRTRLAEELFKRSDIYVGMRDYEELAKAREDQLVKHVIWVDASKRVDYREPKSSMTVERGQANIYINNDGTKEELRARVCDLYERVLK